MNNHDKYEKVIFKVDRVSSERMLYMEHMLYGEQLKSLRGLVRKQGRKIDRMNAIIAGLTGSLKKARRHGKPSTSQGNAVQADAVHPVDKKVWEDRLGKAASEVNKLNMAEQVLRYAGVAKCDQLVEKRRKWLWVERKIENKLIQIRKAGRDCSGTYIRFAK